MNAPLVEADLDYCCDEALRIEPPAEIREPDVKAFGFVRRRGRLVRPERRHRRIALMVVDKLLREGVDPISYEFEERFRRDVAAFGVSPMLVLSLVSILLQLIRIIQNWRNREGARQ